MKTSRFGYMTLEDMQTRLYVEEDIVTPSDKILPTAKAMMMGRKQFGDGQEHAGKETRGTFESCDPLANLGDMNRRLEVASTAAGLGRLMMVHGHVVSEGLPGSNRDLLIELVSSENVSNKPVTLAIRISHGPTCLEPGEAPMFMSDDESDCIHNTEYSFKDGKLTTVSRVLVPGRIPLSWAFANVVVSPDPSSTGVHGAAATTGDSASASASGVRSSALVPPVVLLVVRPKARNIALRAIERYSAKTHASISPEPYDVLSYMFPEDMDLRRVFWGKYMDILRPPRKKEMKKWLKL